MLAKETKSEPILWDLGEDEDEYPFVNNYPSFQEEEDNQDEPIWDMLVEEESCPVYDTDIEDVIEEEEGFVGEEDNIEYIVVAANDLCSSMIQTTLSVDFSKTVDTSPHELILLQKGNLIEVSILIGKTFQEGYLKVAPMVDKLGLKTIKVRGRVIIKKGNLMQGIQTWMLRVQGTSEANSRTSFIQVGENDAVLNSA